MSEERKYEQKPRPMRPMRGRGMPVPKGAIKKGTLSRLLKTVWKYYKWQLIVVFACIILNSFGSLVSSVFIQTLIDEVITPGIEVGLGEVAGKFVGMIIGMACAYVVVILAGFFWHRIMATVTQGMLYHLRTDMFSWAVGSSSTSTPGCMAITEARLSSCF